MKKVFSLVAAIAVMFAMVACGGAKNEAKEKAIQDSINAAITLDSLNVIKAKNDSIATVVKADSIKKADSIAKIAVKPAKKVVKK